jgi:hypothetical protein
MKNMKIRNLAVMFLLTSVSIMATMAILASAYSATQPATIDVYYYVPGDTSFTIAIIGGQTSMSFNPSNNSAKLVEAQGQNISQGISWGNITNSGNMAQNFSVNLSQSNLPSINLYVSSNPSMSDQVTVDTTQKTPAGWANVNPNGLVQIYARANFTNAPGGTNNNSMYIY